MSTPARIRESDHPRHEPAARHPHRANRWTPPAQAGRPGTPRVTGPGPRPTHRTPPPFRPAGRPQMLIGSGCPRATQRPDRWPHGRPAPATREADEPPRGADLPGAAELMGAPCRSGMGVKLPGPLRGDGRGNHRVHDILLACGPPCSGAAIDIVLEGYDSPAAPNASVASLLGDQTLTQNGSPDGDDRPASTGQRRSPPGRAAAVTRRPGSGLLRGGGANCPRVPSADRWPG
jgi:hypothetical protein